MDLNPYQSPAEAPSAEAKPASDPSAVTWFAMSILVLLLGLGVPFSGAVATCWYLFNYGPEIALGFAYVAFFAGFFAMLVVILPLCKKYSL